MIYVKKPTPTPPTGHEILAGIADKFKGLVESRRTILGALADNTQHIQDAMAGARLFGGDLKLPKDILASWTELLQSLDSAREAEPAQKSLFEGSSVGEQTIREAVLDHLKNAGSKGVKARSVRRSIESMIGRQLHYKTIGMTLYRLSEKGLARREGITWFYVPQGTETKTPA